MAHVSLDVPAGLVLPLRDTAWLLFQATAEAMHFALRAAPGRSGLEEVQAHRARLLALGELLDRLGWAGEPAPGSLELSAPGDVLRDALHGALIDAGERLAGACSERWDGEGGVESVRAAATEVIGLDRLLARIQD